MAGRAPCGPIVEKHHFTAKIHQAPFVVLDISEAEVGGLTVQALVNQAMPRRRPQYAQFQACRLVSHLIYALRGAALQYPEIWQETSKMVRYPAGPLASLRTPVK